MLDIVDEAIGTVTKSLQKKGYVVCFAIDQSNSCSGNVLKMNLRRIPSRLILLILEKCSNPWRHKRAAT